MKISFLWDYTIIYDNTYMDWIVYKCEDFDDNFNLRSHHAELKALCSNIVGCRTLSKCMYFRCGNEYAASSRNCVQVSTIKFLEIKTDEWEKKFICVCGVHFLSYIIFSLIITGRK